MNARSMLLAGAAAGAAALPAAATSVNWTEIATLVTDSTAIFSAIVTLVVAIVPLILNSEETPTISRWGNFSGGFVHHWRFYGNLACHNGV